MEVVTDMPIRNHMQTEEWYKGLDEGIRFAVRVLHAAGIETGQSCQGGEGHCYDHPTVDLGGIGPADAAGFAALHILVGYGLKVSTVEKVWNIMDKEPYDGFWRITFVQPFFDRKDQEPMFIHCYYANERCD